MIELLLASVCLLSIPLLFLATLSLGMALDWRIRNSQKRFLYQRERERIHKLSRQRQRRKRRRQLKGIRRNRKKGKS